MRKQKAWSEQRPTPSWNQQSSTSAALSTARCQIRFTQAASLGGHKISQLKTSLKKRSTRSAAYKFCTIHIHHHPFRITCQRTLGARHRKP